MPHLPFIIIFRAALLVTVILVPAPFNRCSFLLSSMFAAGSDVPECPWGCILSSGKRARHGEATCKKKKRQNVQNSSAASKGEDGTSSICSFSQIAMLLLERLRAANISGVSQQLMTQADNANHVVNSTCVRDQDRSDSRSRSHSRSDSRSPRPTSIPVIDSTRARDQDHSRSRSRSCSHCRSPRLTLTPSARRSAKSPFALSSISSLTSRPFSLESPLRSQDSCSPGTWAHRRFCYC
jgi:hypothetical protein